MLALQTKRAFPNASLGRRSIPPDRSAPATAIASLAPIYTATGLPSQVNQSFSLRVELPNKVYITTNYYARKFIKSAFKMSLSLLAFCSRIIKYIKNCRIKKLRNYWRLYFFLVKNYYLDSNAY